MKKNIKVVIIEDENKGRIILSNMLEKYCEGVEVVGQAKNVEEGVVLIREQNPDIVFLDIEMPQENGFHLFYYFDKIDFEVVFTTAYSQYAIKALRISALDYLLKPIDLEELKTAISRYKSQSNICKKQERYQLLNSQINGDNNRIAIPVQYGFTFVDLNDIIRLQAENNYTLFVLNKKPNILVSKTLKEYSYTLEVNSSFLRVHRSHLINTSYIKKIIRTKTPIIEMEDNIHINVPSTRKDLVYRALLGG